MFCKEFGDFLYLNIRSKLKELDREYSRLTDFINTYHDLTGAKQEHIVRGIGALTAHALSPPRPKNPPREVIGAMAEQYIRAAGHPINRSELYRAISRAYPIYGNDPEMVFSTMMWRMRNRFVRLRGQGYWMREIPLPAIGYVPQDMSVDGPDEDIDPMS